MIGTSSQLSIAPVPTDLCLGLDQYVPSAAKDRSSIAEYPHTISGNTAMDPFRSLCGTLACVPEPTMPAPPAASPTIRLPLRP
jgi:hypothetical protein